MTSQKTPLLLGTAQWGWNTPSAEAFRLLDAWLAAGHRAVDCATNFPINRNPADFRAAEKILREYVRAHGLHDLRITIKIGSLDNLRSPEVNLAPSFVLMMGEEYLRLFDDNLHSIMFHWDNRDDEIAIHASLESLAVLEKNYGLRPGLSGIAHPATYARANADLALDFDVEVKHNVFQSDYERYAPLRSTEAGHLSENSASESPNLTTTFIAYGINGGGVKLDADYRANSTYLARGGQPEKVADQLGKIRALLPKWSTAFVRPPVKTMNHIGLIHAGLHPGIGGIVLGVSSDAQLRETLDFWRNLETFDYTDVWQALQKI